MRRWPSSPAYLAPIDAYKGEPKISADAHHLKSLTHYQTLRIGGVCSSSDILPLLFAVGVLERKSRGIGNPSLRGKKSTTEKTVASPRIYLPPLDSVGKTRKAQWVLRRVVGL